MINLLFLLSLLGQAADLGPVDGRDLSASDLERIQAGDPAPDFRAVDETGAVHQLSEYRGHKQVVLVFYRGHW